MNSRELSKDECTRGLSTRSIGRIINFHEQVSSTNSIAEELAEGGAKDGTVVISNSQTKGMGRNGRSFSSPKGGIYLSIILRPPFSPDEASALPLVIGLAVSKAINCTIYRESSVKWPNDVLVEGRKVAGILMSSKVKGRTIDHIIIGIGINLNTEVGDLPEELHESAGSLMEIKGDRIDPNEFVRDLLYLLDLNYGKYLEGQKEDLLDQWTNRSYSIGKNVKVQTPKGELEGQTLGIDQTGALIIQTEKGMQRVESGDMEPF